MLTVNQTVADSGLLAMNSDMDVESLRKPSSIVVGQSRSMTLSSRRDIQTAIIFCIH